MDYEAKKIVAILSNRVPADIALNVVGHLCIAIGRYADEHIMGRPILTDASGNAHLGISCFPLIVTKVKPSRLKVAIAQAKADPSLLVAEYPREMLDTRTDDDLAAALAARPTDELEYLGAVIYGDTDAVNAVTGRFQLWKPEI